MIAFTEAVSTPIFTLSASGAITRDSIEVGVIRAGEPELFVVAVGIGRMQGSLEVDPRTAFDHDANEFLTQSLA
ncbi:MAG: hypothetical protein ACRDRO_12660, partial [Pseudonocardiaceae bacterium]